MRASGRKVDAHASARATAAGWRTLRRGRRRHPANAARQRADIPRVVAYEPHGVRRQHRGRQARPGACDGGGLAVHRDRDRLRDRRRFCSGYAFWRYREVEQAVSRGEFAPPDERLVALLSGVGAALGVLLVVVILTES